MARRKSLVLTSSHEPNVGTVTRLMRTPVSTKLSSSDGAAVHPLFNKAAAMRLLNGDGRSNAMSKQSGFAPASPPSPTPGDGRSSAPSKQSGIFPASPPSPTPASPSCVIDASTGSSFASVAEAPCHNTSLRTVTGREYDLYDMHRLPVDVSSSLPDHPKPRPPSDLMSRGASFATLSMLTAAVKAVEDSRSRPELLPDGTSGVYLLRGSPPSSHAAAATDADSERAAYLSTSPPVAVFKPSDEEAGCFKNPRGLHGEKHMMREGFQLGDSAVRERVAYKLDHASFAGVPKTGVCGLMLRTATGSRLAEQEGSIQEFVQSQGDVGEYRFDGSEFSERACQRLALLDLRLFNCDRHEGNILVRPPLSSPPSSPPVPPSASPASPSAAPSPPPEMGEKLELVPIDHAFVLPRFGHFREAEFIWRYWLAAFKPFGTEAREYVASLDAEADADVARRAGLDEASCATLRACTMLLQAALLGRGSSSVTPNALASMLMREPLDEPSPLERMCAQALGIADAHGDRALVDHVNQTKCGGSSFVPPPEFYARFAELLEERFGSLPRANGGIAQSGSGEHTSRALAGFEPLRRVRSCAAVPEELDVSVGLRGQTPLTCVAETPLTCEAMATPASVLRSRHVPRDYQVGVHTGLGGVPFMEDTHYVHTSRDEATLGVYDGHGGAHAAEYLRQHLHGHIRGALEGGLALTDALLDGFAQAEARLVAEQRQQQCATSAMCGATATVALLRDSTLHVAWLGDCRAVLCRGGDALELTRDHVLVGEGACGEFLRVMGEGGHVDGGRLSGFLEVARAFGDVDPRTGCKPLGLSSTPELCSQLLQPEDEFVIVASDGLWKLLDSRAAVCLARAEPARPRQCGDGGREARRGGDAHGPRRRQHHGDAAAAGPRRARCFAAAAAKAPTHEARRELPVLVTAGRLRPHAEPSFHIMSHAMDESGVSIYT